MDELKDMSLKELLDQYRITLSSDTGTRLRSAIDSRISDLAAAREALQMAYDYHMVDYRKYNEKYGPEKQTQALLKMIDVIRKALGEKP